MPDFVYVDRSMASRTAYSRILSTNAAADEAACMIRTLQFVEPERLVVMFGREHACVEEDHDDDEPVERL